SSGIAFALAFWKKARLIRKPIVAIHCGLLNNPYYRLRRYLTNNLLASMFTLLFGEGELSSMLKMFPALREKVMVNQFGVDTTFWYPGQEKENFVFSIGNDGRRDYETLVKAADTIDHEIIILTAKKISIPLPSNVKVIRW
ncbi:hypothetical protein LCGC14_2190010, partial [marine sediment metagenome]